MADHDHLVEDGEVIDDLTGVGAPLEEEGSDDGGESGSDEERPMEVEDESIHSFEGHSGQCQT